MSILSQCPPPAVEDTTREFKKEFTLRRRILIIFSPFHSGLGIAIGQLERIASALSFGEGVRQPRFFCGVPLPKFDFPQDFETRNEVDATEEPPLATVDFQPYPPQYLTRSETRSFPKPQRFGPPVNVHQCKRIRQCAPGRGQRDFGSAGRRGKARASS